MEYAKDFSSISSAVEKNKPLRESIISLIEKEPVAGKVLEGEGRLEEFRKVMKRFFSGELDLNETTKEIEFRLPRHYSRYENDNRVFAAGWAERLARTNISCYYNQAVLTSIIESGADSCFVEHSPNEMPDSKCSLHLAGKKHSAKLLLTRLIDSYRKGQWGKDVKIPDHPHCTHTVRPA